jgi:hypothetical protein
MGFENRASYLLGKCSTTWAMPPVLLLLAFFQIESHTFCPGVDLRLRSSYLILLSSWDYRCASPLLIRPAYPAAGDLGLWTTFCTSEPPRPCVMSPCLQLLTLTAPHASSLDTNITVVLDDVRGVAPTPLMYGTHTCIQEWQESCVFCLLPLPKDTWQPGPRNGPLHTRLASPHSNWEHGHRCCCSGPEREAMHRGWDLTDCPGLLLPKSPQWTLSWTPWFDFIPFPRVPPLLKSLALSWAQGGVWQQGQLHRLGLHLACSNSLSEGGLLPKVSKLVCWSQKTNHF